MPLRYLGPVPAQTDIAVLARHRHPRLRYVLNQLGRWWGVNLRLFTDQVAYRDHPAIARISYGGESSDVTEVQLAADAFLAGLGEPFLTSDVANLGSASTSEVLRHRDLLSFIFFCLSRYEEYQSFTADVHDRFPATASHAYQNNYLHRPVVNEAVSVLAHKIRTAFPNCDLRLPPHRLQLTYDVDVPYAYRGRGWRGLASGLRDLLTGHPRRFLARTHCLFDPGATDPYDTYSSLGELHRRYDLKARYFFLLSGQRTRFDPNPSPTQTAYRKLIQELAQRADVGVHPSYYSSDRPELFAAQRAILREITGRTVEHSRQHFLRFSLPGTYRELLRAGLRHDHSMGYAAAVGFRAGTNLPFLWYDLEREESTYLTVHPFAAMDVTLRRYREPNPDPAAAKEILLELAGNVRASGGPLTLLWHNSSFAADYGWAGWWEMYVSVVRHFCKSSGTFKMPDD